MAVLGLAVILAIARLYRGHRRLTWPAVNALIARNFPHVPQITVHELARWVHDPQRTRPLLLDVRSKAEYAVSHLHGARWIDATEPVHQALAGIRLTQPIVTYCSVGYRSSAYAWRLIQDGYTDVHNLQGSIFEWANDGLKVYRNHHVVKQVHPYNRRWGQLLKRRYWAFSPSPATTAP